jgi:predicted nucleotide-binding protein (sugar kinase/HSP70/actin superfamily)
MKVLRRYDEDGHVSFVCELSADEMLNISTDDLRDGAVIEVPPLLSMERERRSALAKVTQEMAVLKRSVDLARMLNSELDAARLVVYNLQRKATLG